MIRQDIASDPTLAASLASVPAAPLLAPWATPPLEPAHAAGLDLILEGFLIHHGSPRHIDVRGEPGVLAGDFCYATGLVRVAESGDVEVVRLLADLVARSAGLVGDGRRDRLAPLWRAVVATIAAPDRAAAVTALDAALTTDDPAAIDAIAAAMPDPPELTEAFHP